MANPVLSKRDLFTPAQPNYIAPNQGLNGFSANQAAAVALAPPPAWQADQTAWAQPEPAVARMTVEDVVQKTAISIGMLFLVAAFSYYFLPFEILMGAGLVGGLVALVVPFVVVRRHAASPIGNILYAIAEGLLLGAFSMLFEYFYPGIILQAVLGTFIAAGVTLVAYRFGGFRVSSRFSKMIRIGMMAFVGVALVNLVLFFCNVNTGLFPGPGEPVSILAWVMASVGIGLAVFCLVEDFQFIEHGVRIGAPRDQGWVAAFGLTVTMVWLYINILRILSYIRR